MHKLAYIFPFGISRVSGFCLSAAARARATQRSLVLCFRARGCPFPRPRDTHTYTGILITHLYSVNVYIFTNSFSSCVCGSRTHVDVICASIYSRYNYEYSRHVSQENVINGLTQQQRMYYIYMNGRTSI